MEYTVVIPEPVLNDILEISRWYDLQLAGLSKIFEQRLEEAIHSLEIRPQSFSLSIADCRRIKLKKFPYLLFFKINENQVKIYAIVHTKRSIGFMKKKLKGYGL